MSQPKSFSQSFFDGCINTNFKNNGYDRLQAIYTLGQYAERKEPTGSHLAKRCFESMAKEKTDDDGGTIGLDMAKSKFFQYFDSEYKNSLKIINPSDIKSKHGDDDDSDDEYTESNITVDAEKKVKDNMFKTLGPSIEGKEKFISWIVAAQKDVIRNHSTQIFFETCNLITNTKNGIVGKPILLTNLSMFIYADKESVIREEYIEKRGRLKNNLFLTIVTFKKLLQGKKYQKETFDEIYKYTGGSKFGPTYITISKKMSKCNLIETTGTKERECEQRVWSEIYSVLSDKQIIKAIIEIIKPQKR